MKCPRCGVENDKRTICKDCGYYMYRPMGQNVKEMTKGERAIEDAKTMWHGTSKVLKIAWMVLVVIVMSAVMIGLITFFLFDYM